jgi:hypothetical protein
MDRGEWCGQEWTLRSVDLLLSPATELRALFDALLDAATAADLLPHTVHCCHGTDGYRLQASCDVESTEVTMDGIVRILRQEAA